MTYDRYLTKHLPGRHDQQKHGSGSFVHVVDTPVKIPGCVLTKVIPNYEIYRLEKITDTDDFLKDYGFDTLIYDDQKDELYISNEEHIWTIDALLELQDKYRKEPDITDYGYEQYARVWIARSSNSAPSIGIAFDDIVSPGSALRAIKILEKLLKLGLATSTPVRPYGQILYPSEPMSVLLDKIKTGVVKHLPGRHNQDTHGRNTNTLKCVGCTLERIAPGIYRVDAIDDPEKFIQSVDDRTPIVYDNKTHMLYMGEASRFHTEVRRAIYRTDADQNADRYLTPADLDKKVADVTKDRLSDGFIGHQRINVAFDKTAGEKSPQNAVAFLKRFKELGMPGTQFVTSWTSSELHTNTLDSTIYNIENGIYKHLAGKHNQRKHARQFISGKAVEEHLLNLGYKKVIVDRTSITEPELVSTLNEFAVADKALKEAIPNFDMAKTGITVDVRIANTGWFATYYNNTDNRIEISDNGQKSVVHEFGHYFDALFGHALGKPEVSLGVDPDYASMGAGPLAGQARQIIDAIKKTATYKDWQRQAEYDKRDDFLVDDTELFARCFEQYVYKRSKTYRNYLNTIVSERRKEEFLARQKNWLTANEFAEVDDRYTTLFNVAGYSRKPRY